MKLFNLPIFAFSVLIMNSCGSDEPKDYSYGFEDQYEVPEEEEVLEMISVSWDDLKDNDLKNGQPITIEGFVGPLPSTMYSYDESEFGVDLYQRRNQSQGFKLDVDFPIGSSKNHARSLPEDYQQSDLKIMSNNSETIGVGDYVRIEGVFTKSDDAKYLYFDADKIDLLEKPAFNEAVFETAVELTDEVIENETSEMVYCYMDVKMDLSMYMMVYDGKYTVSLEQKNNSFLKTAYIRIGESEGMMKQLVDDFTDTDFIVFDQNGIPQKGTNGKFRLYGSFRFLDVDSKGTFTVEEFVKL